MKNSLYIILFFFFSTSLSAQYKYIPMVKEGKYWFYYRLFKVSEFSYRPASGYVITFKGDTIINNLNYKKLILYIMSGKHDCNMPPCWTFDIPYKIESTRLEGFIREDTINRKVYLLPIDSSATYCKLKEYILYDFSLSPKDTLEDCTMLPFYDYGDWKNNNKIDTIRYRIIEGKNRRGLVHKAPFVGPGLGFIATYSYFEGFGYENHGVSLSAFSSLAKYCEGSLADCNIISSNYSLPINTQFLKLSPNPTSDQLIIDIALPDYSPKETELVLYDFTGKEVQKSTLPENTTTESMDVSSLPSGIYTLHLKIGGQISAVEKVVVVR